MSEYTISQVCPTDRTVLAQIDALLQQLHQMGISVHEMKQLFSDQLRRFCAQQPKLQVALVECNPEVLAQLKEQLRHMDGIELHTLLLEQVQQHPGRLAQQMDVMITTTEHAKQLAGMTGQAEKVAKIALRLTPQSIAANITAATAVVDMIYNILTVGETRVRQITFATGSVNMRATLQKTRRKAA